MSRGKALVLALVGPFVMLPVTCLIALYVVWYFPLPDAKPFNQAAFNRVVAEIQRGVLQPDRHGVVRLPRDRASLSATGRVYVRQWSNGRLIAFIPSWVGRNHLLIFPGDGSGDRWLSGYIYDSRPQSLKHPQPDGLEPYHDVPLTTAQDSLDDYPVVLGPPAEPPWTAVHDSRAELRPDLCNYAKLSEHWSDVDIFS